MNRPLSAIGAILTLAMGTAQAVFTPLPDGNYRMSITSGCASTLTSCVGTGFGAFVDNGLAVGGIGGISGDGVMGVIDFTLTGSIMSVSSFSQDSYLNTMAVGVFAIRDTVNGAAMTGSIDNIGNMIFTPTERTAITDLFELSIGEQAWNIDNSTVSPGGDGLYVAWTTGTSTNRAVAETPGFTETGSPLQDAGAGIWTGTLVSAGNYGSAWGSFDGTPYSEVFNVQISAVPVPPVLWLFGSGLIGLVGVARRKKAA